MATAYQSNQLMLVFKKNELNFNFNSHLIWVQKSSLIPAGTLWLCATLSGTMKHANVWEVMILWSAADMPAGKLVILVTMALCLKWSSIVPCNAHEVCLLFLDGIITLIKNLVYMFNVATVTIWYFTNRNNTCSHTFIQPNLPLNKQIGLFENHVFILYRIDHIPIANLFSFTFVFFIYFCYLTMFVIVYLRATVIYWDNCGIYMYMGCGSHVFIHLFR